MSKFFQSDSCASDMSVSMENNKLVDKKGLDP